MNISKLQTRLITAYPSPRDLSIISQLNLSDEEQDLLYRSRALVMEEKSENVFTSNQYAFTQNPLSLQQVIEQTLQLIDDKKTGKAHNRPSFFAQFVWEYDSKSSFSSYNVIVQGRQDGACYVDVRNKEVGFQDSNRCSCLPIDSRDTNSKIELAKVPYGFAVYGFQDWLDKNNL